ncbi:MAG: guanylate kinase [Butyrivibrio sp.]|nr:guanylate kinase [Butyrivibrio sp.]
MAKIFVLMGKSSTGKDTVYKRLRESSLEFKNVVIYTTRPMRQGETEGVEYHFVSEETRDNYCQTGKVIERRDYNTVYGMWSYFTVDDGQIDVVGDSKYLVIGTLESYEKFVDYYGKEIVVPIYIEVDDRTRIHRAIEREDMQEIPKYSEMCRRFLADEKDFSEELLVKCGIDRRFANYDLDVCVEEILCGIEK